MTGHGELLPPPPTLEAPVSNWKNKLTRLAAVQVVSGIVWAMDPGIPPNHLLVVLAVLVAAAIVAPSDSGGSDRH